MTIAESGQKIWLHDLLLRAFLKNGFAQTNGNKSWELTELQYLSLTDDFAKGFLSFSNNIKYRKQFFELEVEMIRQYSDVIFESIGNNNFNLIDIYCGDGLKAIELIKCINSKANGKIRICYCPLNASQYLLDLAVSNVKKAGISNVIEYKPLLSAGDGRSLRLIANNIKSEDFKKNVIMMTGGVISCFDINEYLFELNRDMHKDDVLIMGNGVRVGERLVEIDKYKDEVFHNWFKHVMLGLGFTEEDIEFDARFGNSRVEFFYRLKKDRVDALDGKIINFKKGDEFVVAVLYKYYSEEFDKFCKMYFTDSQIFTCEDNGYALVVCKK
ncbi:L-histidine N(alpha)-methyltransferase [Candidatus Pacearchaeota archaeon]|nr:L-histidine N(alpha)-methyltransferase [Candidatus Pacearchaeota archaeon]